MAKRRTYKRDKEGKFARFAGSKGGRRALTVASYYAGGTLAGAALGGSQRGGFNLVGIAAGAAAAYAVNQQLKKPPTKTPSKQGRTKTPVRGRV